MLLPNALISAVRLPRFTCVMLTVYLMLRMQHVVGWHSPLGHSAAFLSEEFLKLATVMIIFGGMTSSVMMLGYKLPVMISKRLPIL